MSQKNVERMNPFENPVVLGNLASFVNCPSMLSSCRSVNREWRRIFHKEVLRKSTFTAFKCPSSGVLENVKSNRTKAKTSIQRLRVKSVSESSQEKHSVDFLQNNGKYLKYISLEGKGTEMGVDSFRFVENVLWKWCVALKELRLVRICQKEVGETSYTTEEPIEISLRKLVLDYKYPKIAADTFPMNFISKILDYSKSLESFVFIGNTYSINGRWYDIFYRLMRQICSNSINVSSIELYNVTIDGVTLTLLAKAGLPLKKIVFNGYISDHQAVAHLNAVFMAYRFSLEHLHLRLTSIIQQDMEQGELLVYKLTNLEMLNLELEDRLNIVSGKFGLLPNLRHLTVWEYIDDVVRCLEEMFKEKYSTSIKSVCLHSRALTMDLNKLQSMFPNLEKLQFSCAIEDLPCTIKSLDRGFGFTSSLKHITIEIVFREHLNNPWPEEWLKILFCGLSCCQLQTLNIILDFDCPYCIPFIPILYKCIDAGLNVNKNGFYHIGFEGFNIYADEFASISRLLVGRSNFVNFSYCQIVDRVSEKWCQDLTNVQLFQDNVDDVINDITRTFLEV